jgi:cytidylate kinase
MTTVRSADPSPPIRDVVAIDGPSGAGKSTVARLLARRLGFAYLDTGAMYRAVTWYLLDRGASIDDEPQVLDLLERLELDLGSEGRLRVNGQDVSAHLRSQEVESRVSAVSALPSVRGRMRHLQREQARRGPIVAEGRDMGSVVFPHARCKFFLDAGAQERARRRRGDFLAAGRDVSEAAVEREMAVRDRLDSTRRDGPLTRTADAVYVDTTGLSIDQVVDVLVREVERAGLSRRVPR